VTSEVVDYPVPWWFWVIFAVLGLLLLAVFSLLAYVSRPPE
jgi:bacteriorhodopsin